MSAQLPSTPYSLLANNTVSPDAVSGRDATITPYQNATSSAPISQSYNANPGTQTYGTFYGALPDPNASALSDSNRMASMIGSQIIQPQLPANQGNLSGVAGLLSALGLAGAGIGAFSALAPTVTATATGGNSSSSSTGGAGGSASSNNIINNDQGYSSNYNPTTLPNYNYGANVPTAAPYSTTQLDAILGGYGLYPSGSSTSIYGPPDPTLGLDPSMSNATPYNGGIDMGPQTQSPGPYADTQSAVANLYNAYGPSSSTGPINYAGTPYAGLPVQQSTAQPSGGLTPAQIQQIQQTGSDYTYTPDYGAGAASSGG